MHPERRAASHSETTPGWSNTSILFVPLKGEPGGVLLLLLFAFCKERQSSPLLHVRADHGHSRPTGNITRLSCHAGALLDESRFVQVTLPGLLQNPGVTKLDPCTTGPALDWRVLDILDSLGWKLLHKYTLLLYICHWVSVVIWLLWKWILKRICYCDSEFLLSWFNVGYLV